VVITPELIHPGDLPSISITASSKVGLDSSVEVTVIREGVSASPSLTPSDVGRVRDRRTPGFGEGISIERDRVLAALVKLVAEHRSTRVLPRRLSAPTTCCPMWR
jgi:hypothetical protein